MSEYEAMRQEIKRLHECCLEYREEIEVLRAREVVVNIKNGIAVAVSGDSIDVKIKIINHDEDTQNTGSITSTINYLLNN